MTYQVWDHETMNTGEENVILELTEDEYRRYRVEYLETETPRWQFFHAYRLEANAYAGAEEIMQECGVTHARVIDRGVEKRRNPMIRIPTSRRKARA